MPTISRGSGRGLPLALTGAVAGTRYVGGNASGAPGSGTFRVGDFVVNADGSIFVCTVAGTPGTWVDTATIGPSVASVFGRTGTVVAASNDYTDAQVQNSPTNVLTATGDLLYASGANTLARRAIGSASQVLTVSGGVPTWAAASAGGLTVFGDGSDGTVTFDGSTVVLGITPSANAYTLARDIFLAAGTINSGVSIITNGYRIFCAGALTNNGTIQWNGNNGAAAGTAGAALTSANSPFIGGGASTFGQAGGAGGATTGANAGAFAAVNTFGGTGGGGGTGTSGAGGNGGTLSSPPNAQTGGVHTILTALAIMPGQNAISAGRAYYGGAGGGGGGGAGSVFVLAKTFAGTGAVQARGGNGGTPVAGNRGGGGGGGGGIVVVTSSSVASGAISGQTIDANGGAKGSPSGTGTDNATAGNSGAVIILPG